MSDIPTWHERAMAHPDHQSGMVSEGMIRARMCEEIADLLAEVERLRAGLHRVSLASQNSMSSKDECGRIAREALRAKP